MSRLRVARRISVGRINNAFQSYRQSTNFSSDATCPSGVLTPARTDISNELTNNLLFLNYVTVFG